MRSNKKQERVELSLICVGTRVTRVVYSNDFSVRYRNVTVRITISDYYCIIADCTKFYFEKSRRKFLRSTSQVSSPLTLLYDIDLYAMTELQEQVGEN